MCLLNLEALFYPAYLSEAQEASVAGSKRARELSEWVQGKKTRSKSNGLELGAATW